MARSRRTLFHQQYRTIAEIHTLVRIAMTTRRACCRTMKGVRFVDNDIESLREATSYISGDGIEEELIYCVLHELLPTALEVSPTKLFYHQPSKGCIVFAYVALFSLTHCPEFRAQFSARAGSVANRFDRTDHKNTGLTLLILSRGNGLPSDPSNSL